MQEESGQLAMVTPGYEQSQAQSNQQQQQPEAAVAMTTGQQIVPQEYNQDQAQFEADKRAVYKHPLFPLLALLFEKCELATQSAEAPNSDSFNMDIQAFVQHQERDRKPFLVNDPEVDGLMIKAIQVLRIHLLELEKVQELCKDFCNRYITCLKGKMQSENLLRSDYGYDASHNANNSSNAHSNYNAHSQNAHNVQVVTTASAAAAAAAAAQVLAVQQQQQQQQQQPSTQIAYQMVQTPQGLVAQPIQIHSAASVTAATAAAVAAQQSQGPNAAQQGIIHGSTPLSQIGSNTCPPPQDSSLLQAPPTPSSIEDEDEILGKKKPKRGVLPKHATSIMRSWLFQHIVHPYPTEDEKRQIAAQTNLTLLQVNNWFINARRRILQPMLDASNPDASHKAKKAKTQPSKPAVQRFWPDNLANLQSHVANAEGGQNGATPNSDSNVISSTVLSSEESEDSSREAPDNSVLDHSDSSSQQ